MSTMLVNKVDQFAERYFQLHLKKMH